MSTERLQEVLADLEQYARLLSQELKGSDTIAEDLAELVKGQACALALSLSYARCEEGL